MKQHNNQSGFSIIELLLVLVVVGIIGGTGFFVWHSKQATDKTLAQSSGATKIEPSKPTIKNYYDCEEFYLKTHNQSQTTCDYAGIQYVIPTEYTNDMIRNFNQIPDALKPTIIEQAKEIFDCTSRSATPTRLHSYVNFHKISEKYYDFGFSCDSGHHVIYILTVDNEWKKIGPTQMFPGCDSYEQYDIPKDLFGPDPAKQTCMDYTTNKTRHLQYKS